MEKGNRFSGLSDARAAQNQPKEPEQNKVLKKPAKPAVAPEPPEQSEPETRRRGRPNGKRSSDQFKQVTAYIGVDTYKRTKISLFKKSGGQQFSELVDQLLVKWLNENE
jgi:uncharacterized Rmd1/YagE family protein